ncbi:anthranilate phosphoribosyltransferase [cyanobiont of Ornithocercus magnificus]|nr:anthranilate phosphoribosyltransferase [cyanobiont of Ornithocercus magnificus]
MIVAPAVSGRERFKSYLRKVGSGNRTSKGMSREEAANALELILYEEPTPAQIGAFLIAHRIRRPEPQELAGMLDTYRYLGPALTSEPNSRIPVCFCMPFDGRTRTAPIYPLTCLLLLACGQPVVLQGGSRMPVKYGVTAIELFRSLGLELSGLSLEVVQLGLEKKSFALVHQPDHFPLAETLISYRNELGKRPPVASLELLWSPHQGQHLLVSGFVHPSTEDRAWEALRLAGETNLFTVKGLEGSTDLPISRTCITAHLVNNNLERLVLRPHDYNCRGEDLKWENLNTWAIQAKKALSNSGPLRKALLWNAGVYIWFSGYAKSLKTGIELAEEILISGQALAQLYQLISWYSKPTTQHCSG